MELSLAINQYMNNLETSFCVQEKLFSKHLSMEDVKMNGDLLRKCFSENNYLLDYVFYRYKNYPEKMNENIYFQLCGFANQLFEKYQRREVELCYEIHLFLLDYVNKLGDKNLILTQRYHTGMMDYFVRIVEIDIMDNHYFDCQDMQQGYFDLDKTGRLMFCKCLGNTLITFETKTSEQIIEYIEKGLSVIDFYNRVDVRECDPDFVFDNWIIATRKNITKVLIPLRNGIQIPEQYLTILCDLARINYEETLSKNPFLTSDLVLDYQYTYYVSLFHTNQISINELLVKLKKLAFTKEGSSYANYEIFAYYLDYMVQYSNMPSTQIQEKAIQYFREYSKQAKDLKLETCNMDQALIIFISSVLRYIRFDDIKAELFEIMIERHVPTYIHTMMVSSITDKLIKQILIKKPQLLIGFKDYPTVEQVLAHKQAIIDCMQDMARFHDIGKYYCMNTISNTYRKLTRREKDYVQNHPVLGYEMLEKSDADIEIKRGVLLHHVYYNHEGGYPTLTHEEDFNHTLVDVLTIADSIDAATDRIGRIYSVHKTYDEIILDLYEQANLRYSKEILDILVKMNGHQDIEESRIALYLSLYN